MLKFLAAIPDELSKRKQTASTLDLECLVIIRDEQMHEKKGVNAIMILILCGKI